MSFLSHCLQELHLYWKSLQKCSPELSENSEITHVFLLKFSCDPLQLIRSQKRAKTSLDQVMFLLGVMNL